MKINGIEVVTNGKFAYDGCHKIYIIEDEQDEKEAIEFEYDLLPIEKLKETYEDSCPLKFISNWKLDKYYVSQFKEAKIEY